MKAKKLTYLLILLVTGVWGVIIYRVLKAASNDDIPTLSNNSAFKKEPLKSYLPADTFSLALNYPDPFTRDAETTMASAEFSSKPPVNTMPNVRSGMVQIPAKYSGYIVNPSTKKIVAIMQVNNRERMMTEGETAEGLKLIRNLKDSVKVSYQGITKFIALN